MEQEPRSTFSARMSSDVEFALVPLAERGGAGLLLPPLLGNQPQKMLDQIAGYQEPEFFVLLRQQEEDGQSFYRIEDARLPEGG